MTREEVKVVFTGLAHDHLMASPNPMHSCTQNHQIKRSSHHLDETHQYNSNRVNQHHNHHHNHHHHNQQQQQHHQHHHHQPLSGCTSDNLPKVTHQLATQHETAVSNGATTADTNNAKSETDNPATALSTIAILRRHPMYDSLVLVKKYRPCLGGYTLEFPTENDNSNSLGHVATSDVTSNKSAENSACKDDSSCGRTKLVSVYLDGDDPIYQSQQEKLRQQSKDQQAQGSGSDGEVVYVPVNGLMDRLKNYDRHGIAIDSRVYAFAMGLKTAERFLTSSTVKEMQEAPPL